MMRAKIGLGAAAGGFCLLLAAAVVAQPRLMVPSPAGRQVVSPTPPAAHRYSPIVALSPAALAAAKRMVAQQFQVQVRTAPLQGDLSGPLTLSPSQLEATQGFVTGDMTVNLIESLHSDVIVLGKPDPNGLIQVSLGYKHLRPGEVLLLDCQIAEYDYGGEHAGAVATFQANGQPQSTVPVTGGHAIYGFTVGQPYPDGTNWVFINSQPAPNDNVTFRGCTLHPVT
jgi:hypothetical protein